MKPYGVARALQTVLVELHEDDRDGGSLILVATDLILSTTAANCTVVQKIEYSCCGVIPDQLHGCALNQPDEQHPDFV